ncbi:MAG TPA: hypothetical protein VFO65_14180 [Acidimicrobiales bacterium]|nr:hypothetical protein [Acidimicrobiales bacterium]
MVGAAVAAWAALGLPVRATHAARTTADEPEYLMTALSLAEDGSLDVSDERLERRYRPFHEALLPVQTLRRPDGTRVSPHDPLLPLVLAAPMKAGGWVAAKITMALMAGALSAVTLWVAVRRFAVPVKTATVTVLAFGLSAPLAVYGTQIYPEVPAALVVAAAIGWLAGPLPRWHVAGAVAAVVALPWLAVKYAPVAAVLAAALLLALRVRRGDGSDRRVAVAAVAALALAALAYLALHRAWYGGWTAYAAGDHFVGGELTAVGHDPALLGRSVRLVGLLVDRSFGLAVWQPLFLVGPVALAALARRRPPGWPVLVAVVAAGWLNATFVALTMHGFWWPGRQTVVVLPAVVVAVAWWVGSRPRPRWLLPLGLAAGAVNVAFLMVEGAAGRLTWVTDFDTAASPLVRAARLVLPDYRRDAASDWALHVAWSIVVVGLVLMGWRAAGRSERAAPNVSR